jgi:hypothetical protein
MRSYIAMRPCAPTLPWDPTSSYGPLLPCAVASMFLPLSLPPPELGPRTPVSLSSLPFSSSLYLLPSVSPLLLSILSSHGPPPGSGSRPALPSVSLSRISPLSVLFTPPPCFSWDPGGDAHVLVLGLMFGFYVHWLVSQSHVFILAHPLVCVGLLIVLSLLWIPRLVLSRCLPQLGPRLRSPLSLFSCFPRFVFPSSSESPRLKCGWGGGFLILGSCFVPCGTVKELLRVEVAAV